MMALHRLQAETVAQIVANRGAVRGNAAAADKVGLPEHPLAARLPNSYQINAAEGAST